jgi:hypothetical protein
LEGCSQPFPDRVEPKTFFDQRGWGELAKEALASLDHVIAEQARKLGKYLGRNRRFAPLRHGIGQDQLSRLQLPDNLLKLPAQVRGEMRDVEEEAPVTFWESAAADLRTRRISRL